jgi:hypothetical protein
MNQGSNASDVRGRLARACVGGWGVVVLAWRVSITHALGWEKAPPLVCARTHTRTPW